MIGRCSPRISHFPVGRHGVSHSDVNYGKSQVLKALCRRHRRRFVSQLGAEVFVCEGTMLLEGTGYGVNRISRPLARTLVFVVPVEIVN